MKIVVIDGQGGRMGSQFIERLRKAGYSGQVVAVGTNSTASAAMLRAGADAAATGENPVLVNTRDADYVVGPIGIMAADALYGEVTPAMAAAVGSCPGRKILIPVNACNYRVAGVENYSMGYLLDDAVRQIEGLGAQAGLPLA